MKTNFLILTFALFSSFVIAQNESESKALTPINLSEPEFTAVQKAPGILDYLEENLTYPETALKWRVEGKVVIGFNVQSTGKLSDFEVIESLTYDCDQTVIRTLKDTNGMWNPGTIDGEPVAMDRKVTVYFKVNSTEAGS